MPVYYDSKKIIPAPLFTIKQAFQELPDGTPIGSMFLISMEGKITADKGSPNSSGTFWTASDYPPDEFSLTYDERLKSILAKQSALRKLFSNNQGKTLEIQPWDGSAPTKCNPRFKGIDFEKGPWVNTCDFVATFEADSLFINGVEITGDIANYKVSSANNEWVIEISDEKLKTYRLTHTASATGKRFYDDTGALPKQAWENAKDYVLNKLTLGINNARMVATGVLDASSLQAFNYIRSQNVQESAGIFSVSETWTCYDPQSGPPAIDDYQVTTRLNAQEQKSLVSVEGTITGFEVRNNSTYALVSTRYTNAAAKWAIVKPLLLSRAQTASGVTLNPNQVQNSVTINQLAGTINYSWEYDNRATPTISGAISEIISIVNDNAADVYAKFAIPGKPSGPLYQDMNTPTGKRRTVTIEIQMPGKVIGYTPTQPATDSMMLSYKPTGALVDSDNENWVDVTGRYSRTSVFTY